MINILVTGGHGFIGHHLVRRLVSEGYRVRILDNAHGMALSGDFEFIHGDIRDSGVCKTACKGIDVIFHTAGVASIRRAYEQPAEAREINVTGTGNILNAAIENNIDLIVYTSSGKVYGNVKNEKSKEDDAVFINSPYEETKYKAETILKGAATRGHIKAISLRYFSVFGPRQRLDYGLLSELLSGLNGNLRPIVYAYPYTKRDFTYIQDVINANVLCLNSMIEQYEVINIASGKSWDLTDVVDIVSKITGKVLRPGFVGTKAGMRDQTGADISKATRLLAYRPQYSLEEGLRKTIAWIEQGSK
jgi:UDP-N-acetylglucosamine/UDP-N-acetylgalactosamine 4-epimerase